MRIGDDRLKRKQWIDLNIIKHPATVSGEAHVSESRISEAACVVGGTLEMCEVKGRAQILGGAVRASLITGETRVAGDARIFNSFVAWGIIAGSAAVFNSRLIGVGRIYDHAAVYDVHLEGNVHVYGDAVLVGEWSLRWWKHDAPARISTGRWTRPPRVYDISDATVTESTDDCWFVNCVRRSRADWIRASRVWLRHPERAERLGVSKESVPKLYEFFTGQLSRSAI